MYTVTFTEDDGFTRSINYKNLKDALESIRFYLDWGYFNCATITTYQPTK